MIWDLWGPKCPMNEAIDKHEYAKVLNQQEFINTVMTYFNIAIERFLWGNLPKTCDYRMLEKFLILNAESLIAKFSGAYFSLGSAGGYDINIYGYPTQGYGYGMNGFNKRFNLYIPGVTESSEMIKTPSGTLMNKLRGIFTPDAVVCYDNAMRYPLIAYILADARRLADLVRSTDVAVKTLKSPIILGVGETEKRSVKALLNDYEENLFAILVARGFNIADVKVWPTNGKPETIEAFWNQYLNIHARLLAILGLNSNPNEDKKERLIVDEVNANNEFIAYNIYKELAWRRRFCDYVNELWGLDITVEINPEVKSYVRPDDTGDGMQDDSDDGTGDRDENPGSDS